MRIVKNLIDKNEKTQLVSAIFDECLKEMNYQFFNKIEFHLQKEDEIKLDFPDAYIYMNYSNPFIQSSDKKAIKIILLKQLICLAIMSKNPDKKIPDFIMEILTNREIIRKGHGKDLFYYYYLLLIQYESPKIQELSTFLKINTPWLSFFSLDNYDSKFLKKFMDRFEYTKAFESATRDLFLAVKEDLLKGKRLDKAIEAYNIMKNTAKR